MACSVAATAREEGVGRRARTDQVGAFRNFISVFWVTEGWFVGGGGCVVG